MNERNKLNSVHEVIRQEAWPCFLSDDFVDRIQAEVSIQLDPQRSVLRPCFLPDDIVDTVYFLSFFLSLSIARRAHLYLRLNEVSIELIPRGPTEDSSFCQSYRRARLTAIDKERKKVNCAHDVIRQEAWPVDTPLRDKLYGDLAALRRTAAFIRATDVPVLQRSTKKERK